MNLRTDWKKLVKRAWSLRFMVAAALFSGLEVGFSVLASNPPIPAGVLAALSGLTTALAFVSRLMVQNGITPEAARDD